MSDLINKQQCDELTDYRPTEQDLAEYAAHLDTQRRYEVLEQGLLSITQSKYLSYSATGGSEYGIGVTDGYRACASIATDALRNAIKVDGAGKLVVELLSAAKDVLDPPNGPCVYEESRDRLKAAVDAVINKLSN